MISSTGTVVGKVNATDRDKQNTDHVRIKYELLSGNDLFTINPLTGVITTVSKNLDREVSPAVTALIVRYVHLTKLCIYLL